MDVRFFRVKSDCVFGWGAPRAKDQCLLDRMNEETPRPRFQKAEVSQLGVRVTRSLRAGAFWWLSNFRFKSGELDRRLLVAML
ncbi:hypothetical protein BaRGS_00016994 [Batillaria attramentaria]|uniref:Uncharacterized protein n=1 Tax=Batillaria attramentaria TaxID=370345 RepID=A0ABD0KWQ2_9CAEN